MSFKISIITATFNRCDYLGRCIESVAAQPYADMEHIIVDGGSTDGTVELLREHAARYPHLRWISEPDRGISDAFNKGLGMMTGNVVGVLGDDDFYEPDIFPRIAETFAAHPEAGIVVGNCAFVRNDNSVWMVQRAAFSSRRDLIRPWRYWGREVTIPAPSTFIRREVIERVGGFEIEDRYAMDYHHWIKITEHFPVVLLDATLANFRFDQGNVSYTQMQRQFDETVAISRKYWGRPMSREYLSMFLSYRWFLLLRPLRRLMRYTRERVDAQQRRLGRVVRRVAAGESPFPGR